MFAVSLLGVSAATDSLEEAQEACKDLEDLERCHGLCVYFFQHNGLTAEYEGEFWEEARDCHIVPEVVVTGQRPPEAEEGIEWLEWDTLEDLGALHSYAEWVLHWSAQAGGEDVADPNRPEELKEAIDDAMRCMLHPSTSATTRLRDTVRIVFHDIREESKGSRYYCEANYMEVDKKKVEKAAVDYQGSYRTVLMTTLMHEFIHVEHHRRYGCPPWTHPGFNASTEIEEEALTIAKTFDEYRRQIGRLSPLDPDYDPARHALIGCPGDS